MQNIFIMSHVFSSLLRVTFSWIFAIITQSSLLIYSSDWFCFIWNVPLITVGKKLIKQGSEGDRTWLGFRLKESVLQCEVGIPHTTGRLVTKKTSSDWYIYTVDGC